MRILTSCGDIRPSDRGAVFAIGNFDGVHPGHLRLLGAARVRAAELGVPAAVLTFEPHPRRFFRPDDPPFLLTALEEKLELLSEAGADFIAVLPFDHALSQMDGAAFVKEILEDGLGAGHVVVGSDFAFGRNRAGSVGLLRASGRFGVTALESVLDPGGLPYSSSRIRDCIARADFSGAARILGREWHISGTVKRGDGRGRDLGCPTANVDPGSFQRPPFGIYAVRVDTGEGVWRDAVASFGLRPMFEIPSPLLEAHILGWDGNIYGKIIKVRFIAFIRPEARFDDLSALKAQMEWDCAAARAMLKSA